MVAAIGAGSLASALLQRWNPQDMNPGVEGTLAAGILGTVLALLEGLPYLSVLKLLVPVLAIQFVALQSAGAPVYGVLGIELIAVGFLGFLAALRPAAPEPKAEQRPAASSKAA